MDRVLLRMIAWNNDMVMGTIEKMCMEKG
jgi:hypothetical protein